MVTKTQAIANFLARNRSPKDLSSLYNADMEAQVLIDPGSGELVKGEFKGHKWQAYKDLETGETYKTFRIPYAAKTEHASFDDPPMNFDLAKHALSIGMTGWDWKHKVSKWVGYDFDSIVEHVKAGLSLDDLSAIQTALMQLPYCTIRKSTSGNGLHIYVFVNDIRTKTHTEHGALARAILTRMCTDTGYDLQGKVDCFGTILWCWDKRVEVEGSQGLQLVKSGGMLEDIPLNWRDHVDVIKKKTRRIRPDVITEDNVDPFEALIKARVVVPLDDIHRQLIEYLNKKTEYFVQWDSDQGMLITHTLALKAAHDALCLRGEFETESTGSSDKNCYCFPMRGGEWSIRRFSRGVREAKTWNIDTSGWTRCYYNRIPDLETACRSYGGIEDEKGDFIFSQASDAISAATTLGVLVDIDPKMERNSAVISLNPRNRKLVIKIREGESDPSLPGWIRKNRYHILVANVDLPESGEVELMNVTDEIRHCVTEDRADAGWFISGTEVNEWCAEPLSHVKHVMSSMGYSMKDRERQIGNLVVNYWTLVNRPFQPEYPGNRIWNRDASQFKYDVVEGEDLQYPTWMKILTHCGQSLDGAVIKDPWCREVGITDGASYLKCWIAALFQEPMEPLPYLFFYGKEDCGKSIFHEAIGLLVTKGVGRMDTALSSSSNFNGELMGLILGVIEETNLGSQKHGAVLQRIKDLVTSKEIMIHNKHKTPMMVKNSLHMVQCANSGSFCPLFPGDTRVVVIKVNDLQEKIPKKRLIDQLIVEAPAFLTEVRHLILPETPSRLRIPVIHTTEKDTLADSNMGVLDDFVKTKIFPKKGHHILLGTIWDVFIRENPTEQITRGLFLKRLNLDYELLKGRISRGDHAFGNVSLDADAEEKTELVVIDGVFKDKE